MVVLFYMILISQKYDQKRTILKGRMADIIVDCMAASYSAHCDSNEAFVYR